MTGARVSQEGPFTLSPTCMISKKAETTELWEEGGGGGRQTNFQSPGICIPSGIGSTLTRPRDDGVAAPSRAGGLRALAHPLPSSLRSFRAWASSPGQGAQPSVRADSGPGSLAPRTGRSGTPSGIPDPPEPQPTSATLRPLQGSQARHQAPETVRRNEGPARHCRPG